MFIFLYTKQIILYLWMFKLCNLWEIRKSYNNRVHRLLWNWNVAIRSLTQQDAFPYTVRDPSFVKYPPAQASNIVIFFLTLQKAAQYLQILWSRSHADFWKIQKVGVQQGSFLTKFLLNPLQQISCVY